MVPIISPFSFYDTLMISPPSRRSPLSDAGLPTSPPSSILFSYTHSAGFCFTSSQICADIATTSLVRFLLLQVLARNFSTPSALHQFSLGIPSPRSVIVLIFIFLVVMATICCAIAMHPLFSSISRSPLRYCFRHHHQTTIKLRSLLTATTFFSSPGSSNLLFLCLKPNSRYITIINSLSLISYSRRNHHHCAASPSPSRVLYSSRFLYIGLNWARKELWYGINRLQMI